MSAVADVWDYYQVGREFAVQRLGSLDWPWLGFAGRWLRFRIQALSFMLQVRRYMKQQALPGIVYSRDIYSSLWLFKYTVGPQLALVFEAHGYPKRFARWQARRLNRSLDGLIVLNLWLKAKWIELGFPADKILVAQDGVDLTAFQPGVSKPQARHKLGLNKDEQLVLYAGHLYPWKGVYTLAAASRHLPSGYRVVFLGGTPEDRIKLDNYCRREGLSRVQFWDYVPPGEVPAYLAAADVLVLPNSGKDERSSRLTSPLKLFEYLAAKRPLVAADVPALREVIQAGTEALMFVPDDPQSLAQRVLRVTGDEALAQRLAQAGVRKAKDFSWESRAGRIRYFMEQQLEMS